MAAQPPRQERAPNGRHPACPLAGWLPSPALRALHCLLGRWMGRPRCGVGFPGKERYYKTGVGGSVSEGLACVTGRLWAQGQGKGCPGLGQACRTEMGGLRLEEGCRHSISGVGAAWGLAVWAARSWASGAEVPSQAFVYRDAGGREGGVPGPVLRGWGWGWGFGNKSMVWNCSHARWVSGEAQSEESWNKQERKTIQPRV